MKSLPREPAVMPYEAISIEGVGALRRTTNTVVANGDVGGPLDA